MKDKRSRPAPQSAARHEHPARFRLRPPLRAQAFERAARLFRAAGEVSRLRMLDRLADGEWCVTELAAAEEVGLSTISQQLRLLKSEHLVKRRRVGKHVYYSLADQHIADLIRSALDHASERRRSGSTQDR